MFINKKIVTLEKFVWLQSHSLFKTFDSCLMDFTNIDLKLNCSQNVVSLRVSKLWSFPWFHTSLLFFNFHFSMLACMHVIQTYFISCPLKNLLRVPCGLFIRLFQIVTSLNRTTISWSVFLNCDCFWLSRRGQLVV